MLKKKREGWHTSRVRCDRIAVEMSRPYPTAASVNRSTGVKPSVMDRSELATSSGDGNLKCKGFAFFASCTSSGKRNASSSNFFSVYSCGQHNGGKTTKNMVSKSSTNTNNERQQSEQYNYNTAMTATADRKKWTYDQASAVNTQTVKNITYPGGIVFPV